MKFGSNFMKENNREKLTNFNFENYSANEMLTCDYLNIIEINKLFDECSLSYNLEPPVFQGEDMLIVELTAQSLKYLFENKKFFENLYQSDLDALEKLYFANEDDDIYEVATW